MGCGPQHSMQQSRSRGLIPRPSSDRPVLHQLLLVAGATKAGAAYSRTGWGDLTLESGETGKRCNPRSECLQACVEPAGNSRVCRCFMEPTGHAPMLGEHAYTTFIWAQDLVHTERHWLQTGSAVDRGWSSVFQMHQSTCDCSYSPRLCQTCPAAPF